MESTNGSNGFIKIIRQQVGGHKMLVQLGTNQAKSLCCGMSTGGKDYDGEKEGKKSFFAFSLSSIFHFIPASPQVTCLWETALLRIYRMNSSPKSSTKYITSDKLIFCDSMFLSVTQE